MFYLLGIYDAELKLHKVGGLLCTAIPLFIAQTELHCTELIFALAIFESFISYHAISVHSAALQDCTSTALRGSVASSCIIRIAGRMIGRARTRLFGCWHILRFHRYIDWSRVRLEYRDLTVHQCSRVWHENTLAHTNQSYSVTTGTIWQFYIHAKSRRTEHQ
jgi:hypothetical protein